MIKFLKRCFDKQIDGTGLGIFRIIFFSVLLCEVIQLFNFRHLIYDTIPFIKTYEINFFVPLIIWMLVLMFMITGIFTRMASVINYIMCLMFFSSAQGYSYHMFWIYITISFLSIFLPISQTLSIDRLLKKLKYSNTQFRFSPSSSVSKLSYYIPIIVGIAFVYLDSTFFKIASPMWRQGLGMWKPASLPFMVWRDTSVLLNSEFLVKFMGYLSIAFEFAFLFLFPFKKFRLVLMMIGVSLHIGILIVFPIPYFAIGFGALYILMVPVYLWRRLFYSTAGKEKLTFYYDAECPLCARTRIVVEHFDIQKRIEFKSVQYYAALNPALKDISEEALLNDIYSVDKNNKVYHGIDTYIQVFSKIFYLIPLSIILRLPGIYHIGQKVYGYVAKNRTTEHCTEDNCGYAPPPLPAKDTELKLLNNLTLYDLKFSFVVIGLSTLIIFQCLVSYNSSVFLKLRQISKIERTMVGRGLAKITTSSASISRPFLGITSHDVFLDGHFEGYRHIIALSRIDEAGNEVFLPITRPSGQPGSYLIGPTWCHWGWAVLYRGEDMKRLETGIRNFTAFYAVTKGIGLKQSEFIVKVKTIDEAKAWEYDFLKKQIAKPWKNIGTVSWNENVFSSSMIPIN